MCGLLLCLLLLLTVAGCDATPDGAGGSAESADRDRPTATAATQGPWTEAELALLESLTVSALPRAPSPASNRVADDPGAAELGHRLFFEPSLSRDGRVSCATCHLPGLHFTDGRATSWGLGATTRNAPTLIGAAHSPWMYWDGRRDSLWAQALAPLEASVEMGSTRLAVVRRIASEPGLAALYARTFGSLPTPDQLAKWPASAGPYGDRDERAAWQRISAQDRRFIDRAFANTGKAIAAYERLLRPGESRFDRYVKAQRGGASKDVAATLSDEEIRGLRLFIDPGRTLCLRCHNGPLLTNQSFHDIGTELGPGGLPDFGRFLGVQAVLIDPFNCLGAFSDAQPDQCQELRFLDKAHVSGEMGKFKTPTLRGLARTGPYMHDGRFETLTAVMDHYQSPPAGSGAIEITPLAIDGDESRALIAFLGSLDGGTDVPDRWLRPPDGGASAGDR